MISVNKLPKWIRIGWVLGRIAGWPFSWFRQRPCLLVIHSGSLGDGLLFTGAIRELRNHEQGKQIVLVVSERAYPLFQRCPHVNQVVAFAMGMDWGSRVKRVFQAARLFARPYEAVLSPDAELNGTRTLSFSRRYLGIGDAAVSLLAMVEWVSLISLPGMDPYSPHQLDRMVHLLQSSGYGDIKTRQDIWPETYVADLERTEAAAEIGSIRREHPGALVVAVCAGARFRQKDWGSKNFSRLLVQLAEIRPVVAVLLGAAADRPACDAIGVAVSGRKDLYVLNKAGQVGLHESMALIGQSDVCIGNDTFGLHVAVAVGTPSVVVMWGGDHERWAPWGDPRKHRMVRSDDRACFGCRGECVHKEYRCMTGVAVDSVLREVLFTLN